MCLVEVRALRAHRRPEFRRRDPLTDLLGATPGADHLPPETPVLPSIDQKRSRTCTRAGRRTHMGTHPTRLPRKHGVTAAAWQDTPPRMSAAAAGGHPVYTESATHHHRAASCEQPARPRHHQWRTQAPLQPPKKGSRVPTSEAARERRRTRSRAPPGLEPALCSKVARRAIRPCTTSGEVMHLEAT